MCAYQKSMGKCFSGQHIEIKCFGRRNVYLQFQVEAQTTQIK